MHGPRASSGFTLVELITIMILVGILAVVAFPRLDGVEIFRSAEFRDRVVAALRHAHKTAIAQRRVVRATFAVDQVTLDIDGARDGAYMALRIPGNTGNAVSGNGANAVFSPVPPELFFQPDGRVTTDAGGTVLAGVDRVVASSIDGLGIRIVSSTGFIGDAL